MSRGSYLSTAKWIIDRKSADTLAKMGVAVNQTTITVENDSCSDWRDEVCDRPYIFSLEDPAVYRGPLGRKISIEEDDNQQPIDLDMVTENE